MISLILVATVTGSSGLQSKVDEIRHWFEPNIGNQTSPSTKALSQTRQYQNPMSIRGKIHVKPPKGKCIFVQKSADLEDSRICNPTDLTYKLESLDEDGRLTWNVMTKQDQDYFPVSWPTSLQVGKYVSESGQWPGDDSQVVFLHSCRIAEERTVRFEAVGWGEWKVRFPKKDWLLMQPPKGANLYTQTTEKPLQKQPSKNIYSQQKPWYLFARDAYGMPGHHFVALRSDPPGGHGYCRYKFSGFRKDPTSGVVECHDTSGFKFVLLPLRCLAQLKRTG